MSFDNNSYENSVAECDEGFIDNSKMFSRWYKFTGRIGRLEFGLTIIIGILIYAFSLGFILQRVGGTLANQPIESIILAFILISILPLFLIGAASCKRANDCGKSPAKYLATPVVVGIILLFRGSSPIGLFGAIVFGWGSLIFYKSVEGANEHGSQPK